MLPCGFTGHSYVRQGILFAMAMMLEATHTFAFVGELESELTEVVQWLNGMCVVPVVLTFNTL